MQRIVAKIRQVVNNTSDAGMLVYRLNPILRGWANYYSGVTAKKVFAWLGYYLWKKLYNWTMKKHRGVSAKGIRKTYWTTVSSRHWVFKGTFKGKV